MIRTERSAAAIGGGRQRAPIPDGGAANRSSHLASEEKSVDSLEIQLHAIREIDRERSLAEQLDESRRVTRARSRS